jgi:CRP/FNR family transcriptional regulator
MVRNGATLGRPFVFGAPEPIKVSSNLPCGSCIGRTFNLCRPLEDARLQHLLSLGGIRHWKRHETLFRAGDPIGAFFKIRKGIVAVSHTLDDGRRQITALRAPGDCVGYLDKNGAYAFEGEALTDVEACAFDRRKFDAYVAEQPDLAAALVDTLSSALTQAGMLTLVLGQLRSTERVAHFLAEISALYAERHVCSAKPLTLHMGRNEIADYLGLTIETVSRSIGKLKSRNIIALVESGEVVILDHERLRQAGKVTA